MRGSCIIDGIDIADFGMFILKGGDYDFLSFPERKEPEQNNWHEYDGIDADLSEIYFKEKKVVVRFYIKADSGDEYLFRLNSFYALLSAPGYRNLYSREFDKTFNLRYLSCSVQNHKGGLYKGGKKSGELTVEFSMDAPLQIFSNLTNLIPRKGRSSKTYVTLNGYDLAEFGIIVNQCYNTVLCLSSVKQPLIQSIDTMTGLKVFKSANRTFEAKQVVIECTMLADTCAEFYHNYEALFNNLTVKRSVELGTFAEDMECFYSSMQDFQKLRSFSQRAYVKFNLVLTQISPGLIEFILGTEDSFGVITETDDYFIEM
jgi:hypothetical protein